MVVVSFADPATTPPMTPIAAGMTMNHFLPNLSLKNPWFGQHVGKLELDGLRSDQNGPEGESDQKVGVGNP